MTREELLDKGVIIPEVIDDKLYYYHSLGYKVLCCFPSRFTGLTPIFITFNKHGYDKKYILPLDIKMFNIFYSDSTNQFYCDKSKQLPIITISILYD